MTHASWTLIVMTPCPIVTVPMVCVNVTPDTMLSTIGHLVNYVELMTPLATLTPIVWTQCCIATVAMAYVYVTLVINQLPMVVLAISEKYTTLRVT